MFDQSNYTHTHTHTHIYIYYYYYYFSIVYFGLLLLNNFLGIFGLLESLNYVMIEWCIDVLNEVWKDEKVRSRHSIFRKENIVLRLLLRCIDLWVSCEWDDPDSTNIMKSHRWSYSVGESRKRSIWLSLRFERTDQSRSNGFILSYEDDEILR